MVFKEKLDVGQKILIALILKKMKNLTNHYTPTTLRASGLPDFRYRNNKIWQSIQRLRVNLLFSPAPLKPAFEN